MQSLRKKSELLKVQAGKLDLEIRVSELNAEAERVMAALVIQEEKERSLMEELNQLTQEKK